MTFFEHIDALRPHLIRVVLALLVMMIAAFVGSKFILDGVLMAPASPDFFTNRILCNISHSLFNSETLCINQLQLNVTNFELGGQFNLNMQVSLVCALVVGIPYFVWEIWRFISPALTEKERGKSRMFVFYVSLCFFVGLAFGYYVIVPLAVNFLASWQASEMIQNMFSIKSYISSVLSVSLACAVVFQLPLLIYFLARIGVITSDFLRKYRRYAIVLLLILSAFITPPDILSLFLVMIPLYSLYELSIVLAARVEKKKAKEEAEYQKKYGAVKVSEQEN